MITTDESPLHTKNPRFGRLGGEGDSKGIHTHLYDYFNKKNPNSVPKYDQPFHQAFFDVMNNTKLKKYTGIEYEGYAIYDYQDAKDARP